MNIFTVGSCLSRWTANKYCEMFDAHIQGSVYHNRVDYLYETVLTGNCPSFTSDELEALIYSDETLKKENSVYVSNQLSDENFGSHLLDWDVRIDSAFLNSIDLILMDPFMDLGSKLSVSKDNSDKKIFIVNKGVVNYDDLFSLEKNRLFIKDIVFYWKKVSEFFVDNGFKGKIVFMTFPFMHHPNNEIRVRAKELSRKMLEEEFIDVIPMFEVPNQYLDMPHSISHFKDEMYAMYAGLIHYKVNQKG